MEKELLRSKASLLHVLVVFVNKTERIVNLYWMDYDGLPRKLITLNPGERKSTNTFMTHPWIFRDFLTGERMYVENNCVFWPKPLIIIDHLNNHLIKRKQIDIHLPIRTLRENCLWKIVKNLNNSESIYSLELPNNLKIELVTIFREHKKHKNNPES